MSQQETIKLYATAAHECSYLPERQATTVFVDPDANIDRNIYSQLSEQGFRRSGSHLYRPHCGECQACISVRIPINEFSPNRSQRRCLKNNADIRIESVESIASDEHYRLYESYISQRHADGDMYPASKDQYLNFLTHEWNCTEFLEFRLHDQLIGVAVTDRLENALSAIYTFFDCRYESRSLGRFGILTQVQRAKALQLDYLYLGYWIRNCQKMNYKTQYRPLELLIEGRWLTLS